MLLKQKMYLSLVLAIIVPLAVSTFIFSSSIRSHTAEKLAEVDLPTALNEVKNEIELALTRPIIVSKEVAQNSFVKNWLINNEDESNRPSFIEYLATIKQANRALTAFIVSEKTKNYYTEEGITRQVKQEEDKWFYEFLSSDKPFDLSIDVDENSQQAAVFINYAVEVDGVRTAVAGIGRSLDSMTNLVKNHRIGKSGVVYLVSDNGTIMLHGYLFYTIVVIWKS